jgi:16S rRNA (cytosine1402-N4)-methyltransferase
VSTEFHIPVLSHEAVELLINPNLKNRIYVDGTLGGGGYTNLICKSTTEEDRIIAVDKDLHAIEEARAQLKFCEKKLEIVNGNFGDIEALLAERGITGISGIVLDLGLSSYQLEHEEGFSYLRDTELDMRAFKKDDITAGDVLNEYSPGELQKVFENYGEIGKAARLVKAVVEARRKRRIETTFEFNGIIDREYKIGRKSRMDFLSKIYQALRIETNNELKNLENVLSQSLALTEPGGRLVIVSYHSLEDRIVKTFFREHSPKKKEERKGKLLKVLTKKPVIPGREEIKLNRRSRSAKLRAAEII